MTTKLQPIDLAKSVNSSTTRYRLGHLSVISAFIFALAPSPLNAQVMNHFEGRDFINCSGASLSECKLKRNAVLPAQGIHTRFTGSVNVSCEIPGVPITGGLSLKVGQQQQILPFGKGRVQVDIEGYTALEVIDNDPALTGSLYFLPKKGCDLVFDVRAIPSFSQLAKWETEIDGFVDATNTHISMINLAADLRAWHDVYISSPSPEVKSILEKQIELLKDSPLALDQLKALSLQKIINGIDFSAIFGEFNNARLVLTNEILPKMIALKATLDFWDASAVKAINKALQDADYALNK